MTERKIVTAASAKRAASMFNYGNLASVIIPALIPFWFGASMFIYAMNRHNPNHRVGYYTQWAAYRFYGLIGLIIPVGTFFPAEIRYYLITWAVLAAIIIPLEIIDLRKIAKEEWHDTEYEA
jgi:hypothetical protein